MSPAELDDLVANPVKEDLYIEYKHGNELLKKDAPDTIRQHMSGFANSAGGVLIIGVDAPHATPTDVTGCQGHKKGDLAEWAARCLNPIASSFSPIPRFHVVPHPKGDVLVGVTQRSLGLVSLREAESIVYYFRLHDQTLKAPDYLMADLLLGRRQQPILYISDHQLVNPHREFDNSIGATDFQFELRLNFENMSIVWAEDCRWGIIAWVQQTSYHGMQMSEPSSHLLSFLEVRDVPDLGDPRSSQLRHIRGIVHIEEPFEADTRSIALSLPLHIHNQSHTYIWRAALYVTAKNSLPIWHQINIAVDKLMDTQVPITSISKVIRLTTERPVVAWEETQP